MKEQKQQFKFTKYFFFLSFILTRFGLVIWQLYSIDEWYLAWTAGHKTSIALWRGTVNSPLSPVNFTNVPTKPREPVFYHRTFWSPLQFICSHLRYAHSSISPYFFCTWPLNPRRRRYSKPPYTRPHKSNHSQFGTTTGWEPPAGHSAFFYSLTTTDSTTPPSASTRTSKPWLWALPTLLSTTYPFLLE